MIGALAERVVGSASRRRATMGSRCALELPAGPGDGRDPGAEVSSGSSGNLDRERDPPCREPRDGPRSRSTWTRSCSAARTTGRAFRPTRSRTCSSRSGVAPPGRAASGLGLAIARELAASCGGTHQCREPRERRRARWSCAFRAQRCPRRRRRVMPPRSRTRARAGRADPRAGRPRLERRRRRTRRGSASSSPRGACRRTRSSDRARCESSTIDARDRTPGMATRTDEVVGRHAGVRLSVGDYVLRAAVAARPDAASSCGSASEPCR